MSSLENLNCPQFVDFTSPEAFDINDGADYFFERGVVGQIDLGLDMKPEPKPDTMQELMDKFKTMTNLNSIPTSNKPKQPLANSSNTTKSLDEIKTDVDAYKSSPVAAPHHDETKSTPPPPACVTAYKANKQNKENQPVATCTSNKPIIKSTESDPSAQQTPTTVKTHQQETTSSSKLAKLDSVESKNRAPSAQTTPLVIETKKTTPILITNQQNIVKKTLAKMTAAFKQKNTDLNLKTKLATDKKTKHEPIRVEHEKFKTREMSPESEHGTSNRRASSVPRTLREKQALSKQGIVVLESIDDVKPTSGTKDDSGKVVKPVEHKSLKPKVSPPTAIISLVSSAKKKQLNKQSEDRRRSRSCNESISIHKTGRHVRRSTNEPQQGDLKSGESTSSATVKPRIPASPSTNQLKQRPRSGERAPLLPMYTGVKFVPKIQNTHGKYPNMESGYTPLIQPQFNNTSHNTSAHVALPLEDVLKNRPACLQSKSKPIKIDLNKKPVLANRSIAGKSASFKHNPNNTSITNTSISQKPCSSTNVSLVKPSSSDHHLNSTQTSQANTSAVLDNTRTRKKSETKQTSNGYLHTELRALKRQEYEQTMKEKEKLAQQMKHDLDLARLKKQQEEIQKIRIQRTFRSNPIKHYKPVDIRPSEKPLTEPKSPHLCVSTNKLANLSQTSKNDSFNTRSFAALVDAPVRTESTANSNLFRSNSLLRNNTNAMNSNHRNIASSHDDIRF